MSRKKNPEQEVAALIAIIIKPGIGIVIRRADGRWAVLVVLMIVMGLLTAQFRHFSVDVRARINSNLQSNIKVIAKNDGNRTTVPPRLSAKRTEFLATLDRFLTERQQEAQDHPWLREYLIWHFDMRDKFPDVALLLDDPESPAPPGIWIACHDEARQSGGLADRSQYLVELLKQAHKKKRVVLIKWYNSRLPLEAFLVPHLMNFTLPSHQTTDSPAQLQSAFGKDATSLNNTRIQIISLKSFGTKAPFDGPYGLVWHAIFQPSDAVQTALDETKSMLGLVAGEYFATHCRFGHPAALGKRKYSEKDFRRDQENNYTASFDLLNTAKRGIECCIDVAARRGFQINSHLPIHNGTDELSHDAAEDTMGTRTAKPKIYFYADSTALVQKVIQLMSPPSLYHRDHDNYEALLPSADWTQLRLKVDVVGRENATVAHLKNRQSHVPSEAFLSTFVDLYLAAEARCISLGVGRFGYMAAKISGTKCLTRYQVPPLAVRNRWGMRGMDAVPVC